jgi:hypothetical protein
MMKGLPNKKRNNWRRWPACVLLLLCAAWPATAQTASQARELRETYDLGPNGVVSVTNVSGYIRVTSWNENRVQVDAVKRGRREEDLAQVEIVVTARPDRLEIRTNYPRGRTNNVAVDYDLKVPRGAVLNALTSVSGEVTISGPVARVVARSTSGGITAQDISGEASLASTSGNLRAERIGGALTAATTSGEVQINDVGSALEARSTSGNIRVTKVRDDVSVNATSGSLRIEGVGGRVNAKSVSGWVTVFDVGGDVTAVSTSDAVTVENVRGRAVVHSINGRLTARKVAEGVRANSLSGPIEISQAKGRIEAGSTSGAIILSELDSNDLRAKSMSGTVRYTGKLQSDGLYELESFSGDIIIQIPADSEFALAAKTFSGSINTEFPLKISSGTIGGKGPLRGAVGKGGAELSALGFSGSVHIRKIAPPQK